LLDVLEIFEPDIFGINESHFDCDTTFEKYQNQTLDFGTQKHILTDKNGTRSPPISGTSIFSSERIKTTFSFCSNAHEIISCTISDAFVKPMKLIYAYISPSSKRDQCIDFFTELINQINLVPQKEQVLIVGHLNAKSNLIHPTNSPCFIGELLAGILDGSNNKHLDIYQCVNEN